MSFLTDPAWLAVIVAIIAIFPTIIIYLKQNNVKGLVYEVVSNTPVFSIEEAVKGKIQVLYNGKPIDYALLAVLKIWNYGNAPIEPSDYILPITFDFGNGAEVLDAEVLDTEPNDLKKEAILDVAANKVTLKPVLLNGKDSIQFKVLLTRYNPIKASARVRGVHQIITPDELPGKKIRRALLNISWRIIWPISAIIFPLSCLTSITLILIPFVVFHANLSDNRQILSYYPPSMASFANITFAVSIICVMLFLFPFSGSIGDYLARKSIKKMLKQMNKSS